MAFATTTLTAPGSLILTKPPAEKFVRITLTGTFTGLTADLSASLDQTGGNFAPVGCMNEQTYAKTSSALLTTSTQPTTFMFNGAGMKAVKLNISAIATGSVVVNMYSDDHGVLNQLAGG
jgi:hypothetical protein